MFYYIANKWEETTIERDWDLSEFLSFTSLSKVHKTYHLSYKWGDGRSEPNVHTETVRAPLTRAGTVKSETLDVNVKTFYPYGDEFPYDTTHLVDYI